MLTGHEYKCISLNYNTVYEQLRSKLLSGGYEVQSTVGVLVEDKQGWVGLGRAREQPHWFHLNSSFPTLDLGWMAGT